MPLDAEFVARWMTPRASGAHGGRKLTMMAEVAVGRFSNFTDDEVTALHRYLQTIPK